MYIIFVDNVIYVICNCKDNESCVHLENGNKEGTIEGKFLIANSILLILRLCIMKLVNFIWFMYNVYWCVLGNISSTCIDKSSDICAVTLQELHISVDNMTDGMFNLRWHYQAKLKCLDTILLIKIVLQILTFV